MWHLLKSQGQAVRDTRLERPTWTKDTGGHPRSRKRELSHKLWASPLPEWREGPPLTSAWGSACLLGSPERTDVVMDIKHLARVGAEQVAGQSPPG